MECTPVRRFCRRKGAHVIGSCAGAPSGEREKKRGRERAQKESARRERVREESEDQFPLIGCLDRLGPGYGKRTGA